MFMVGVVSKLKGYYSSLVGKLKGIFSKDSIDEPTGDELPEGVEAFSEPVSEKHKEFRRKVEAHLGRKETQRKAVLTVMAQRVDQLLGVETPEEKHEKRIKRHKMLYAELTGEEAPEDLKVMYVNLMTIPREN